MLPLIRWSRVLLSVLCVGLLGGVLSCGGAEKSAGPVDALTGSFLLRNVGGTTVPVIVVQDATGRTDVMGGNMTFAADHTWASNITYRFVSSAGGSLTVTLANGGSYRRSGSSISMHDNRDASDYSGTIGGNVLTFSREFGPSPKYVTRWEQ
jgi:hypothetical protein